MNIKKYIIVIGAGLLLCTGLASAQTTGNGIYLKDAQAVMNNSIVWGNKDTANAPANLSGSGAATYSCVEGGVTGIGNINGNPLFVSTVVGSEDYRLQGSSPCIGTGTGSVAALPVGLVNDMYGIPFVAGGNVNMGAFGVNQYTVSASAIGNGSISPLGDSLVNYGGSIAYTITPNTGYHIDSVLVNGINIPDSIAGKSYTFTNVAANHTIRAVFKSRTEGYDPATLVRLRQLFANTTVPGKGKLGDLLGYDPDNEDWEAYGIIWSQPKPNGLKYMLGVDCRAF